MRRRNSWLVDAVMTTADVAKDHLVVRAAGRHEPDPRLSLVLNLADRPYAAPAAGSWSSVVPAGRGAVAPHGWAYSRPPSLGAEEPNNLVVHRPVTQQAAVAQPWWSPAGRAASRSTRAALSAQGS